MSGANGAALSPRVIPGRRAGVEPGIHRAAEHVDDWIPDPTLARRPGMTVSLQSLGANRIIRDSSDSNEDVFMKIRVFALTAALFAFGSSLSTVAAAELSIAPAHRSGHVRVTPGYVFWDDVYPPAIYGPYLRSIEEVRALKAAPPPLPSAWWYEWNIH
jgi:hypothetical protein